MAFTPVYITGTVVAPLPCVINGNKIIDVNFGDDLLTSGVDGKNYIKTVDYSLECNTGGRNALKLQVQGNSASFDGSALQTNLANLGIALKANGNALAINGWINFTYPYKPVLQAVPVKRTGSTLANGKFTSAATLMISYQ